MPGLIADANVQGHFKRVLKFFDDPFWLEVWRATGFSVVTFEELQLSPNTPDDELWRRCQREDLLLFSANRNQEGPHSLEAVLRASAGSMALPVLPVGDAARILRDREYAEQVAVRILEIILDLERVRGTGRLFIP